MMPFNNPIPQSTPKSKASSGLLALVEWEKWMQIALVVPCTVAICWGIGALLDNWLHHAWIGIAGVVFGVITGLVCMVQMALAAEKSSRPKSDDSSSTSGSK